MARLDRRLLALESAGRFGDVRTMSDEQLMVIIRKGVRELEAKPSLTDAEQRDLDLYRSLLVEG